MCSLNDPSSWTTNGIPQNIQTANTPWYTDKGLRYDASFFCSKIVALKTLNRKAVEKKPQNKILKIAVQL